MCDKFSSKVSNHYEFVSDHVENVLKFSNPD